jgi:hypothetical protein
MRLILSWPRSPKKTVCPPFLSSSSESKAWKMGEEGWWMVQTIERPEAAMRLMFRMITCAALESKLERERERESQKGPRKREKERERVLPSGWLV